MVSCANCGRELTDPLSIDRGLGPECLAWIKVNRARLLNPDRQGYFSFLWMLRRKRLEEAGVNLEALQ